MTAVDRWSFWTGCREKREKPGGEKTTREEEEKDQKR